MVRRRRHRIQAAWYRDGVQGLAADCRATARDAQNDRGVGDGTEDIRPHQWVGWETPLGRTGLCSYPYGPTRVGLRRIAVQVRHGRPRKRPRASESDRRRQGRRRGRREPRAAEHPGDRGIWGHASYLPRRKVRYHLELLAAGPGELRLLYLPLLALVHPSAWKGNSRKLEPLRGR